MKLYLEISFMVKYQQHKIAIVMRLNMSCDY